MIETVAIGKVFLVACLGLTVAGSALAGYAIAAAPQSDEAPRPVLAQAAAPARFVPVQRPIEAFSLFAPGLAVEGYAAERRGAGDERRDTITLGAAGSGATVAVSVHRKAAAPDTIETAANRLGATAILSPSASLATKFGPMTAADASDGAGRPCLAFARHDPAVGLAISGLVCGEPGRAVDARKVACLVDRLDYLGGGDLALRSYFAAAETRRDFCGTGDLMTTPGTRLADAVIPLPPRRVTR